jgi:hypothetical protein
MENSTQTHPDPISRINLLRHIYGIIYTQLIFVAAKLGIADLLKDGPKSIEELAKATDTIPSRLYRVMRTLDDMDIFLEIRPRHFCLTPIARLLQTDIEGSLKDLAIYIGSEWHVKAWANILLSLKSEKSAFQQVFGMSKFEYLEQHPEDSTVFNNAMTSISRKHAMAICDAYDFSQFDNIVDVGGGYGLLLATILQRYPTVKGILFDLPSVTSDAPKAFTLSNVGDGRYKIIKGNFFVEIPKGGDTYLLKNVIHDWDDDDAFKIIQNCRKVMPRNGKLLIIDNVITSGSTYSLKKLIDIEMLVTQFGRERTEDEFKDLFSRAGILLNRIITTKSEVSIIEGIIK